MSQEAVENVMDYMKQLPLESLSELYSSPFTCQTIFRSLPPLAQQYVVRLLFVSDPMKLVSLQSAWPRKGFEPTHDKAISRLVELKILIQKDDVAVINSTFRESLIRVMIDPLKPSEDSADDANKPTQEAIREYSIRSWEAILSAILSPETSTLPPNIRPAIQALLVKMHVVNASGTITAAGYRFLMSSVHHQTWQLVLAYVDSAADRGQNRNEVLTFLFQLGFQEFGKGYSVELLSESKRMFLEDLSLFGLVYRKKNTSKRYYPTSLAIDLSAGSPPYNDRILGVFI